MYRKILEKLERFGGSENYCSYPDLNDNSRVKIEKICYLI